MPKSSKVAYSTLSTLLLSDVRAILVKDAKTRKHSHIGVKRGKFHSEIKAFKNAKELLEAGFQELDYSN